MTSFLNLDKTSKGILRKEDTFLIYKKLSPKKNHDKIKRKKRKKMKKIISILGLTASLVFAAGSTNGDSSISTVLVKNCIGTVEYVPNGVDTYINWRLIDPLIDNGKSIRGDDFDTIIKCTNGTAVTITMSSANNWKLKKGSEEIPYIVKNMTTNEVLTPSPTFTFIGDGLWQYFGNPGAETPSASDHNNISPIITVTNNIKPGTYTDTVTTTWSW
jgi:hypothetical protein